MLNIIFIPHFLFLENRRTYKIRKEFHFSNTPIWMKVLCKDCITCQFNQPFPHQKQLAEKQDFTWQNFYSHNMISINTKSPISLLRRKFIYNVKYRCIYTLCSTEPNVALIMLTQHPFVLLNFLAQHFMNTG